MRLRKELRWGWLIAGMIGIALPVNMLAQTASDFVYVFPKFSPDPAAELVLSNLSPKLVTADISFYDPAGRASAVYAEIAANGQMRATPTDFAAHGARNFQGAVVVRASGPLSAQARIPFANGFKTLAPSRGSRNLIVPFSQGTLGTSEVSIYNDNDTTVSIVMIAVAPNGSMIGSIQLPIGPHATYRDLLQNAIPAVLSSSSRESRDVSHLLIRAPNNVLGSERRVFALASLTGFADAAEGIRQRVTDTAFIQAVPEADALVNTTVPVFVQGSGYFTLVQVINASQFASNVTLTARATDGTLIGGSPVVVALPAAGAIRRSAQNLFNLPSGFSIGSITIESATPTVSSAGIGASSGGFVVTPSVAQPAPDFVFALDGSNAEFFVGLTFLNSADIPATLTIRYFLDDGTAITRTSLALEARSSITRNVSELLPEVRNAGFVHVSSDVPIVANALYGRIDNTLLAVLAPMHSQPDYNPPDPTTFLITGTARHNGAPLPGVSVQLSGPAGQSAITDQFGTYVFQSVAAGAYNIRARASGYTFSPSSINITIQSDSSRGNDFAATLIVPSITTVQPSAIVAGNGLTPLIVAGTPLTANSEIVFEGRTLPTTLTTANVSLTSTDANGATTVVTQNMPVLKATLDAASVALPRMGSLFIRTTGPGGSASSPPVSVAIGAPAPVLTSWGTIPQPLMAGNAGFTTTINGSGFASGVTVLIQGVPRPTTMLSSTAVQVTIPPEDLATGRFVKVQAINPAPTVGPSNALDLPVLNPTPGVLSISPTMAEVRLEVNAPPIRLTVNGFGFKAGARIQVGTFEIPTTFVSSTRLLGDIPQKALLVGGAFPIMVLNPAPAAGTSEALPFLLLNLPPVLESLEAGELYFDSWRPAEIYPAPIIVRGSNFGPNTAFELRSPCAVTGPGDSTDEGDGEGEDGSSDGFMPGSATIVSSHQAILVASIACVGVYQVRVRTPQPGGGVSDTLSFFVNEYWQPSAPSITSLSPSSARAGSSSVTLRISGFDFETGAVVNFGGAVLVPATVTSSRITVIVPAYLLTSPDMFPVVVTNPSNTGSSNRMLFTVF
jgi:hypothetical protein